MPIRPKDIIVDIAKTLGDGTSLIAKPYPFAEYKEGVNQGIGGMTYPCLCERLNFEKINVKIPGQIVSEIEYTGHPVRVSFDGLEAKLWQDYTNRGELKLSITAKNISTVDEKKRIKMNTGE